MPLLLLLLLCYLSFEAMVCTWMDFCCCAQSANGIHQHPRRPHHLFLPVEKTPSPAIAAALARHDVLVCEFGIARPQVLVHGRPRHVAFSRRHHELGHVSVDDDAAAAAGLAGELRLDLVPEPRAP